MKSAIEILKRDLSQALAFLKKKYRQPFGSRLFKRIKASQWYIVMGASGVGKTSLLLNSDLNLVDIHDRQVLLAYPTQHCQWLFSDHAVFLDMTGRYGPEVWSDWLKQLSGVHGKPPIQGLLIAFDLKYSQPGLKQFGIIKETLEAINPYIHNVPIYIAFTQCDYIAGFVEFFEDLGIEEQKELFGVHFSGALVQQDFLSQFEEKFDALVKRLNQRMVWRLHQERQIEKKMLIKHFPMQLLALKDNCRELVKTLTEVAHLNLMGMYFTSSLQKGRAVNYLDQEEKNHFPLASQRLRSPNTVHTQHKRFFIGKLFDQILKAKPSWRIKRKTPTFHYFVYGVSTLILVGALVLGYQHYQKGLLLAQETRGWLQGLDVKNQDLLKTLNQLNQTRVRLQKKREEQLGGFYLNSLERLYQSIDSTYFKLLTSRFSKQLKQTLEKELNAGDSPPNQRYRALKVYLMLGDEMPRDNAFIQKWFQTYWNSNLGGTPATYRVDLLKYLDQMLASKETISLHTSLVKKTRTQLKELPMHQVAWMVLSSDILKGSSDAPEDFPLWSLKKKQVPLLFEREHVKAIYDKTIPEIYQKLAKGDSVLQAEPASLTKDITKSQIEGMIAQTRAYYLTQYHDFWKKLLKIDTQAVNGEGTDAFKKLGRLSKRLAEMDWTPIRKNTRSIPEFSEFNQVVSPDFADVNSAIQQWNQLPVQEALKNIDAYLSVIMDSHSGAFVAARMRMEDNGEKDPIAQLRHAANALPSPLRESFIQVAESVWSVVLKQAHVYLNQKWEEMVLPFYRERLKDRYPLFKTAQAEIALEDMGQFFSQEGILTQFFKRYIQFFVDQRNFYWEWKKVDGKGLDIPQTTLEAFIRGNLIKKMFFAGQEKYPSFRFSMELTGLSGRAREGIFQFNDQYINYFGNANKVKNFVWPGQAPYLASIEMLGGQEGKLVHRVKKGPWALFRLLDEARLETLLDSRRLNVVFDVDHEIMRGLLVVDTEVNPLINGILNAFRCPEAL